MPLVLSLRRLVAGFSHQHKAGTLEACKNAPKGIIHQNLKISIAMENSMKQANDNYQKWQDRHDVEKALFEWEQNRGKYATAYNINGEICYSRAAMKSFAQDFAERVKGAPIKTTKTKKHD